MHSMATPTEPTDPTDEVLPRIACDRPKPSAIWCWIWCTAVVKSKSEHEMGTRHVRRHEAHNRTESAKGGMQNGGTGSGSNGGEGERRLSAVGSKHHRGWL